MVPIPAALTLYQKLKGLKDEREAYIFSPIGREFFCPKQGG